MGVVGPGGRVLQVMCGEDALPPPGLRRPRGRFGRQPGEGAGAEAGGQAAGEGAGGETGGQPEGGATGEAAQFMLGLF